ncbi:Serine/threonine-protein kinase PknD [compost metagenome]
MYKLLLLPYFKRNLLSSCVLRRSVKLVSLLVLMLWYNTISAQQYVTYPIGVQTFTQGIAITNIEPTHSGISSYGYKSVGSRLDVGPDFMDYPAGLTSDQNGNLYVCNLPPGSGYVSKFTPTGLIPQNDPRTGPYTIVGSGFSDPYGVVVDEKYIYVVDGSLGVRRITIATNATVAYGSGISTPVSIAVNKKGEVFAGQSDGYLKKIAANGTKTTSFGPRFVYPTGLVVDNLGNVFVADYAAKTIVKLSATGQVLETFTGFARPHGLAMDNAGNLLIADGNSLKVLYAGSVSGASAVALNAQQATVFYEGVAVDAQGIVYGTSNNVSNLTYVIPKGGFFITPALPSGLTFDYNTGVISGTPLEGSAERTYTVYGYDANSEPFSGTVTFKVNSPNADLADLSISVGTLNTAFDPTVLEYETSVINSSITITPTLSDFSATVTVNGNATASATASTAITLSEGLNAIPVVVTASDGTVKTYTVKVTRTIGLNSLAISSGTLAPVFSPTEVTYTAIVQPDISNLEVTAVANDPNYIVKINTIAIPTGSSSANIALDYGLNTLTIEVSSADGLMNKTYTLTVRRLKAQIITFPALGTNATGTADFDPGATVDSGLPITYVSSVTSRASIVSGKIRLISTGTVNITARQSGNTEYAAATSVVQPMTITKGAGTITFAPLPDKTIGNANFAPGATSTNSVSTITYTSSNTAVATITGSGSSLRIRIVGAGTTNITANQASSAHFLASTSVVQTLTVNKITASIDLSNLSHTYDGSSKSATATTTPAALTTVAVTYDGATTAPTNAGTYTVVATLNNATYAATATATMTIAKAEQVITFPTFAAKNTSSPAFEPGASTTANLPITYTSSDNSVAEVLQDVNDGDKWKVKINGFGTADITAIQAGNGNYNSASLTRQLTVSVVTLPVTMKHFDASIVNGAVQLRWQTFSETGNKTFKIYRSAGSQSFTYLGEVLGAGNSSTLKNYLFEDKKPLNGDNYYRLVQIDDNGNETNVGEKVLNFKLGAKAIAAFPNPTTNKITIDFEEGQYSSIELVDYNGKVLERETISTKESRLVLSLDKYPSAGYLIRLKGKQVNYIKVVKI